MCSQGLEIFQLLDAGDFKLSDRGLLSAKSCDKHFFELVYRYTYESKVASLNV